MTTEENNNIDDEKPNDETPTEHCPAKHMHVNSLAALNKYRKPLQKGFGPNPGGKPKSAHFRELILEYLQRPMGKGRNIDQILRTIKRTKPEILLYYAYGKPSETIAVSVEQNSVPPEIIAAAARIARGGVIDIAEQKPIDVEEVQQTEPQPQNQV